MAAFLFVHPDCSGYRHLLHEGCGTRAVSTVPCWSRCPSNKRHYGTWLGLLKGKGAERARLSEIGAALLDLRGCVRHREVPPVRITEPSLSRRGPETGKDPRGGLSGRSHASIQTGSGSRVPHSVVTTATRHPPRSPPRDPPRTPTIILAPVGLRVQIGVCDGRGSESTNNVRGVGWRGAATGVELWPST